jgi:hypothetical protein
MFGVQLSFNVAVIPPVLAGVRSIGQLLAVYIVVAAGTSKVGAVLSITETVKSQVIPPQLLVAVTVTDVTPKLNDEPEPVPEPLAVVAPVNEYVKVGEGVPLAVTL